MVKVLAKYIPICLILLQTVACQNRVLVEVDHYERNGQLDKAEIFLKRHLDAHPNDADAHFRLGELHGRMHHYQAMLKDFETAVKHDGLLNDKVIHRMELHWRENFNRGVAALNRNEPQQAITPLRHAVLIQPERHAAYPVLAAALMASPDSGGALAVLEKACALNEDDLESRHALLQLYYAGGQDQKALQLSEEILEKSSRDLSALRCRAMVLQRLKSDQTENAFRDLLSLSNDAEDLLAFAMYYYRQQHYDDAGILFRDVLQRRGQIATTTDSANFPAGENSLLAVRLGGRRLLPEHEILRYLGDCAWHLGDYAAMSDWYTRLLQIRPNDTSVLQNLLLAAQAQGRQDQAELIKKQLDQLTGGQE